MNPPPGGYKRSTDKILKRWWLYFGLAIIIMGGMSTLFTNLFGRDMKPACRAEITALKTWVKNHGDWSTTQSTTIAVRLARLEQDIKYLKEQGLTKDKKLDRLLELVIEVKRNGGGRK